ncbi:MAG: transposase family protein [Fibrobacteres bacterium]|nr:transposase family protein [Fibrobacterota bacterium]
MSEAITRFGIPERFYTDNGSAFRTLHLQTIAARPGFTLPHTPAYRPQGRGKIERFFGTLRRQFLDGTIAASRKEWNLSCASGSTATTTLVTKPSRPPPIGAATLHTKPPAPFPRRGRSSQEGIPPGGATQGPPRWNRPARWCHMGCPRRIAGRSSTSSMRPGSRSRFSSDQITRSQGPSTESSTPHASPKPHPRQRTH